MSTTSGETPTPNRKAETADVRDSGQNGGARADRGRWKVPLLIFVGGFFSIVLAAVNGLQLASLERALGGVQVPEGQLGGYDVAHIELVRSRMNDELLERYGASHYLWDMLFPLVFAGTMILMISRLCAGRKLQRLLMIAPALFVAVDIAENLVLEALMSDPVSAVSIVAFASTLTVAKSVLLALSLIAVLTALLTRPRT